MLGNKNALIWGYMLFPKKRYTLLIGKDRIDPGLVVLDGQGVFHADEALAYSPETFASALAAIGRAAKGRKVRIVLCEELVYVTELLLPAGTELSRELVRQEAEASIPEDLQATDWDFQSVRYASKSGSDGRIAVQVAVIRADFSRLFHAALSESALHAESIVPESYAFATLVPSLGELSVVAAMDGSGAVLVAIRDGFVVASETEAALESGDIETFIAFSERRTGMPVARLVCSGIDPAIVSRPAEELSLNPLIGAAMETRISGDDASVLNLAIRQAKRGIFR